MEFELQTLVARLSAHRWLPRRDTLVKRALTDELFRNALNDRLAACGMELVEHPYADNVALRIRKELEQPVFGGADIWLSNNLDLKRDQVALLVVLWAMLVLPKRQRQIERRNTRSSERQNEMFAVEKPVPTAAELNISVAEATLLADFGDRLGGKTRITIGLGVLSRHGFIDRRDGRIYEGPMLDLVLDYNRMARRVLDGTLADLFNTRLDDFVDETTKTAPDIDAPGQGEEEEERFPSPLAEQGSGERGSEMIDTPALVLSEASPSPGAHAPPSPTRGEGNDAADAAALNSGLNEPVTD